MEEMMKVTFRSLSPLLMHSNDGVNPMNPISKKIKEITKKRTKTEEDLMRIMELEYELAIYFDKNVGVHIPAICVEGTIRNAAKKIKKGTDVKCGVFVGPDYIPLIYDGPKTIDELFKDERFQHVSAVTVNRSSVMRCRPRFDKWAITFDLQYDSTLLNRDEIAQILDIAGKYIGICDYRPRYGRFEASTVA